MGLEDVDPFLGIQKETPPGEETIPHSVIEHVLQAAVESFPPSRIFLADTESNDWIVLR